MKKIVHDTDAYEGHVLYWNVKGDLFHDKTLKKLLSELWYELLRR